MNAWSDEVREVAARALAEQCDDECFAAEHDGCGAWEEDRDWYRSGANAVLAALEPFTTPRPDEWEWAIRDPQGRTISAFEERALLHRDSTWWTPVRRGVTRGPWQEVPRG